MYIMPWHIVFLRGLVSFFVCIEKYLIQVSFLQLLAVGYPLPESFSSEELLEDPTMRSTLSEMLAIFVFERQISHAKQIYLSVKITNSNAGKSEKEERVFSLRYFMFKTFIMLKYFHIQTSAIKRKYPTLIVRIFLVSARTHSILRYIHIQTLCAHKRNILRFLKHGTYHVVVRGGSRFCQPPIGGGWRIF